MSSGEERTTGNSEADALWLESYRGEVLGEAYFSRMAQLASAPEERRKIGHLVRLERSTREMLEPWLRRRALPTDAGGDITAATADIQAYDWRAMLEGVRPVAASYLAKYRQLAELVDEDERAPVEALIAHESALDTFCRMELEGSGGDSLGAIESLPHFR